MSVKKLNQPMTRKEAQRLCDRENRYFPGHRVVKTSVEPGGPVQYVLVYSPGRAKKGGA